MDYPSHPTHCREVRLDYQPLFGKWARTPPPPPPCERAAEIESAGMSTKFLVNSGVCEWLYLVQSRPDERLTWGFCKCRFPLSDYVGFEWFISLYVSFKVSPRVRIHVRKRGEQQSRKLEKAQQELDGFSLVLISLAGIRTKQILRQKSDCKQSVKNNRGRTLQACQNRKMFCPAQMTSLISMLTKDDWLLHLFIYLFHLFDFDWFFCRCSLATVIELQWSNIFFILAQESLLEVFVSTLKVGMAIFQWGWRYMAVKKVFKFFIFYHSLSMWLYQRTPCRELCQTQACDFQSLSGSMLKNNLATPYPSLTPCEEDVSSWTSPKSKADQTDRNGSRIRTKDQTPLCPSETQIIVLTETRGAYHLTVGCRTHNGKRFTSLPQNSNIRSPYALNPKKGWICVV